MKRFLLSVAIATSLAFTSCQFDDSDIWDKFGEVEESIRDHEERISALEELCKQMNTNIEALQTLVDALEKRDYITNISPIREDGVVIGYTISFAYSDTITIYHGEDGKDGANGKDGYTPQIGVMKDTDGIYYWTLDGEWLLDGKGNKIQANGVNGTNGSNGANGTNGVDGITPRLKIENDYWYVSYDNGVSWQQLGKATGEDGTDGNDGVDGEDGKDGDSIFKSVTQDDEYVYFNLADGTMITLPKHDKENIQFEDLQVKAICCKNWDTNNDGELSYAEAAAVETIGTAFKENTNIIAFTELKHFTGIAEISDSAFYNCTNLWKIELPHNVISIGSQSFYACKGLSQIILSKKIETVGSSAFDGCTSLPVIDNIRYADTCIVGVEDSTLDTYTIREGTRIIGYRAFKYCDMSSITIPDSVVTIDDEAFRVCTSLAHIIIGSGVSRIGCQAFQQCASGVEIYCKSLTPPSIYFYRYTDNTILPVFPYGGIGAIYVPRNAYNAYTQYTYQSNGCFQTNWYVYKNYIKPYDFE